MLRKVTKKPKRKALKILVTAGATREAIDPVRFISNYATGFFGCQIAREAKKRGHRVILISGPMMVRRPQGIRAINVESCRQMQDALRANFAWCDCLIMNAAVGDFRVEPVAKAKIKKQGHKQLKLRLKPNPDILASLALEKGQKRLIGFALESNNLRQNAQRKLKEKNLDLLVATKVNSNSYPFGRTKLNALIMQPNQRMQTVREASKGRLSRILLDSIEKIVLS